MNKRTVHEIVSELVTEKKTGLEALLLDLRASNTETKSSMGDKYETSREMIQQEINRLQGQLKIVEEQSQLLKHLKTESSTYAERGSLVETEVGWFYISVSYGKFRMESKTIFAISEESPLAKALLGKKSSDVYSVNSKRQTIKNIW